MRFSLLLVVLLLSGCAVSSTFIDRSTGTEYRGKTLGGTLSSLGELQAEIEGEAYQGSWVYMASGGSVIAGTGTTVTSSGSTAFGSLSAFGIPTGGKGTVNMKGEKGSLIRCVYEWNDWTSSGIGECERNDGRRYDLRLKQ
jgi:hypothetical protein